MVSDGMGRKDTSMDRTAFFAFCWFCVWTAVGTVIAKYLEIYGGGVSGGMYGFVFALVTTLAWPWILPDAVWAWLDQ